jgi:hypothetical protein
VHWMFTLVFWRHMRLNQGFAQEIFALGLCGLLFCVPLHKRIGNFWIRAVLLGADNILVACCDDLAQDVWK